MKKERKKGQITVFIIITVFLFLAVAVGGLFFVKDNKNIKEFINERTISSEFLPVYELFDDCANQRVIDGVRIVGLQGGYINPPNNSFRLNIASIGYGYYDGKNVLPSKEKIQKELNSYISTAVRICLMSNELDDYDILNEKPIVNSKINSNNVKVSLTIPISATKNNNTYKFNKNYDYEVPIKLGDMIDTANKIIKKQMKNPDYIPVTFLAGLNYDVISIPTENSNIMVYAVVDRTNRTELGNVPFSFLFANEIK